MSPNEEREALAAAIARFIDRCADGTRDGTRDDAARDELLARLARWQLARVEPFARLNRGRDPSGELRAVPTDVFRFVRVASHPEEEDTRVFLTSGTTSGARGRHAFADLSLYDRAADVAARHALFPDLPRMRLVMLAPHPDEAPESSLSYMLGRFEERFGTSTRWTWHGGGPGGALDLAALEAALDEARRADEPVALLGTSFAFVHAEDGLGDARFELPRGSRIMQTGGTKGRSREVDPAELRRALAARYGVDEPFIVAEYGMTELSSQMYETTLRSAALGELALRAAGPRRLWVPPWVRARVVDPERLAPCADGVQGVLRIDDLANLGSVCAIQTADLAIAHGDAIELLGRMPGATPRGCSLAIEEALG